MEKYSKTIIIATLIAAYVLGKYIALPQNAITLHFIHVNIFHLLANCWAIYIIKKLDWIPAYFIAAILAVPFSNLVGFSGVIFAALGILYGKYPSKLFWKSAAIVLVTGMLPNISVTFHLLCLFAGFIAGYIYQMTKLYVNYRNR